MRFSATAARAKLEDARRSIGEARNRSPLLAVAVELRRELGMAALEYMANPGSDWFA